jgi:perosamine synthetase
MSEFIMQMRPFFGQEEKNAISEYMNEDGFITEFKRTTKFEELISEYTRSKHCIVVNNGTISMTLAALALEISRDDEVLVPNYTMIATPNSIKMIGAKPVFVDVDPETLIIDLEQAKNKITKNTKLLMLVSANGRFPKNGIDEFETFSRETGIKIIEDAAQSLGSFYPDGRHIGLAGQIGSFSFSMPKIITTGQGGALITNDDELAKKIRRLKDFGRDSGGNDIHTSIGYNFKFTELQACIGIEQMKKLKSRVQRKKEMWIRYYEQLKDIEQIILFEHDLNFTAPWFIDCLAEDRNKLMNFLKSNSIGTRVMYPPINEQKAYSIKGDYTVSKMIGKKGLWLPSFVQLSDDQIDYICKCIRNFYKF